MAHRFQCFRCNLVKDKDDEKAYVYASSTKNVKVLVCETCHTNNIHEMQTAAEKFLGGKIHLGVLRGSGPKPIASE
jgi:hypothetical protein